MELRTPGHSATLSRFTWTPDRGLDGSRTALCAEDIMSKDVVTASLDDTIRAVAQQMADRSVSCIVVTAKGRVVGILTEKDMLHAVAGGGTEFYRRGVSEQMSSPVHTIGPDTSVLEADRMMEVRCIRRLPVVEDGRLLGIVTQTDITRASISLHSLGCVSEVMSTHVVTVPVEEMALEAARRMSCSNASCLLVMRGQTGAGLLTEKDLLKRVIALQKDLKQTRILDIMSLPVVTVPPHCSLLEASKKMEAQHFHRLLVAEGQTIYGMVTQSDILGAIRRSAEAAASQRRVLHEQLSDLVQRAIRDLQRVRDYLGEIPHPSGGAGLPARPVPSPPAQTVPCAAATTEES
ncbi:MAG: CBS domain-containing protein [Planctomycetes bacterium]|nr:CBS domain-containing protein [Planctomycetota bacterium]